MADFPALNPSSRIFTPGVKAHQTLGAMTGDSVSVINSNASTGWRLRLSFNALSIAEHFEITSHYMLHGRFEPFALPAIVTVGSDMTFPSGYAWLYVSAPETSYSATSTSVSVELELLPPYTI